MEVKPELWGAVGTGQPQGQAPAAARVKHQGRAGRISARSCSLESASEVRTRSRDRDLGQPPSRAQPDELLEEEAI